MPLRERVKHFFLALVDYAKYATQQPRTATARSCSLFSSAYECKVEEDAYGKYDVFVLANAKTKWCKLRQPNGSPCDNVSYI